MATIHQHKPDVASYHNYLEMSGSQESSQQKGGGKGRFYNERENTRWGNRKGKQKAIPVWFFPLLWLLPLKCSRLSETHDLLGLMELREICVSHQGMCTQTAEDQQLCWIPATWENTITGKEVLFGACSYFKLMKQFPPNLKTPPKTFQEPFSIWLLPSLSETTHTGAGVNWRSSEADGSGSGQQPGGRVLCLTLPIFCCYCRTLYITHALCSTSCTLATQNSHPF